jgi:putative cell wall-binding protein
MFVSLTPASATQDVVEHRIAGPDRYATAALVAQATFTAPNPNIILVSGQNFPDGLSAAGLSGAANAPILLTPTNSLPVPTISAMAALFGASATKTVHILGGTAAVSAAVATQVTGLGYTVNRVAGADRYTTAAAIAAFQATLAPIGTTLVAGSPLRTAIIATGANFPDALSAGGIAFAGKHPILLTQAAALPAATSAALTSLAIQRVILLGGETAVTPAVATAITALGISVTRVSGADRGATAKAIADVAVSSLAAGGFNFYGSASSAACRTQAGVAATGPNVALIIDGDNFADAMSAAPHSGTCRAPMLIGGSASTATFATANSSVVGIVRAIGGTTAVPATELTAAKTGATTATPTAALTIYQGNTVITVDFSETIALTGSVGTIRVNNGVDLCAADAALPAPAVPLAAATCYYSTVGGKTTVRALAGGALAVGDSVVATGFTTPAPARAAATATATVPASAGQLTASITASPAAATGAVTFSRPVGVNAGAANVTITRAGVTTNVGPLTIAAGTQAAQYATVGTITVAGMPSGPAAAFQTGDIVTVIPAAATGVINVSGNGILLANVTTTVGSAGAAPTVTKVTGVVNAVGGLLNTTGVFATNVAIFADAALPAGAIVVQYVQGAGVNLPTSAVAVFDNTTGVTTITVTLGTDGTSTGDATPGDVAAALNVGTAGAVVTALPSNPASVSVLGALGATPIPAGTRTLIVTATASKPLSALPFSPGYDVNGDNFDEAFASATFGFVAGDSIAVYGFTLGVGAAQIAGPTVGTSKIRFFAGDILDLAGQPNAAVAVAFSAP